MRTDTAAEAIQRLKDGQMPRHDFNPGVVTKLIDSGLAVSFWDVWQGKTNHTREFLKLTAAGRVLQKEQDPWR